MVGNQVDNINYINKWFYTICLSFVLCTTVFLIGYIYIDYSREHNLYKRLQATELKSNKIKVDHLIKSLRSLLHITINRIEKLDNNHKHIQSILNSLDYFSSFQIIPPIEKASYFQIVSPNFIINRFGVDEIKQEFYPTVSDFKDKIFIEYKDEKILVNGLIVNNKNEKLGILSLKVKFNDFKKILGESKCFLYEIPTKGTFQIVNSESFKIHSTPYIPFKEFILIRKFHYFSILGYMLISLLFTSLIYLYIRKKFQNKYSESTGYLKSCLKDEQEKLITIKNNYENSQEEFINYQIATNALKSFYTKIYCRQEEHSIVCEQAVYEINNGSNSDFSYTPKINTLAYKDNESNRIPLFLQILTDRNRPAEVNFATLLKNTQQLFADKIFKSNIMIDVKFDQDIPYKGDVLLMEFILINIIGKIIFRVPKNGKITIKISQKNTNIHLTIQDNGYSIANIAKKLVEKSFDLFMEYNNFQLLCNENGVEIEHVRTKNAINVTKINISQFYSQNKKEENVHNVISLF